MRGRDVREVHRITHINYVIKKRHGFEFEMKNLSLLLATAI